MKTVVFVREEAYARMYNQAWALKRTNKYRLILLCRTFDETMLGKFKEVFDEIICWLPLDLQKIGLTQIHGNSVVANLIKDTFNRHIISRIGRMSDTARLPKILKQINADVFNCVGTYELTQQVMKNTKSPVIIDLHNGSPSKGIENLSKMEKVRDKYCLEHASGIIHRGPPEIEINYYKKYGYKIKNPTLQFLDCCNREFFVEGNIKKLSSEDGEYHLISMGSGQSSHYTRYMIKKLAKQKIHFHIYVPYKISPLVFKELVHLTKNEKYFHLEKAVPFDKVHQEIAKYDFGSHLYTSAFLNQFQKEYLKIGSSNRIFTYLEAGLPIIISDRIEYMKKLVEKYKAGFSVKDEELDDIHSVIDKYDYEELRKNVFKAREKFLINNYAERLIKFYDEIIQKDG
ncbi:MAG: hypothetical protein KKA79_02310 [Nanoarchaeota archaeon]|nr:hypothetical protein [Nanoarchaeota archaeon]MCG2718059.1 hypothetical protein [Nanoarchaeota archaeon]